MIRGNRILDVRQSVGQENEARPYRVIVQALNREYVFAAESCKDMCEWSMSVMQVGHDLIYELSFYLSDMNVETCDLGWMRDG